MDREQLSFSGGVENEDSFMITGTRKMWEHTNGAGRRRSPLRFPCRRIPDDPKSLPADRCSANSAALDLVLPSVDRTLGGYLIFFWPATT